ncbi:sodium/calcium exchanger 1-like [Dysidea avara]|uniref:sodium/calcium exchanger 1-like n=1 Tax=Dysidea avara TaxID=196820 RepID=UPI00332BA522
MMFSDYYTPIGSGIDFDSNPITITIEAGSTEGRGNISVSCDNVVEGVETFDMNLTLASNNSLVRVGRDTSIGRITDSTVVVNIAQSSYETRENSSIVTLTLTLSQVSSEPFEVVLTTMDITATDVEDYNGTNITVEVSAGVLTQSFTIDIIDNDVVECDEVFSVTIESVTTCGVTTGNCISSNVTIMDDDEAVLSLNQTEYSISEDDGQLLVGVTLSRVTSQDVTVLVTITDGTTTGNIVKPMTI